jgi:signal transduction histidine kinase
LTSIHGALGLLASEPSLSSKAKQLIDLAYRNSKLLSTLIQDTVDIERIESGKIDFRLQTVHLSNLIHEAIRSADLILGNGHIQIVEEAILPDIEVRADGERLTQVLLNLLSNAIKFSPQNGRVFVSMQLLGDKVRVSVRDEGAGIPEEFQKKIFGRFEQAAMQISSQQKGTGLGLSISKMIIEKLGGTIGFESKPGQGAVFYFDLPVLKKQAA